jgi:hypothetical protein
MHNCGVKRSLPIVSVCALALLGTSAQASTSWSWSSSINSTDVSGSASFSIVADGPGFDLVIVLDNTADELPSGTADILTGLYFDLSSTSSTPGPLSMYSAVADLGMFTNAGGLQTVATNLTAGTNACAPGAGESASAPNATNCTVDGGWESAYQSTGIGGGASAAQHWAVGTSGQTGIFHGNDVNTFDYGVAPGGGVGVDPTAGGGLGGAYPPGYIDGEVTFTLQGLTTSDITISNVSGAYGTAPEGTPAGTSDTSTPEPATMGLFLAGCALLLVLRRTTRLPVNS